MTDGRHDRTPVVRAFGAGANPTAEAESPPESVESRGDSGRSTRMSQPADAEAEALVDRLLGRGAAEPVTGVYRRRTWVDVAALEAINGELLEALETIGADVGVPWDDADSPEENAARVREAVRNAVGRGR